MELSDEARAWIARCKDLNGLIDDDGIVCLPAVCGEPVAVDRLRALLARAFGDDWSAAVEAQLLRDAGCDGLPLSLWLRDKFFEQHVTRFQKRPFIWHLWDGHKEGFSALVNYHLLTREKLNTLINPPRPGTNSARPTANPKARASTTTTRRWPRRKRRGRLPPCSPPTPLLGGGRKPLSRCWNCCSRQRCAIYPRAMRTKWRTVVTSSPTAGRTADAPRL